jgi:hypothetical protein
MNPIEDLAALRSAERLRPVERRRYGHASRQSTSGGRETVKAVYDEEMRSLAISLLLFLLLPLSTFATTTADDQLIDKLMAVRQFGAVDISPDGTRVAWARTGGGITTANIPDRSLHVITRRVPASAPSLRMGDRSADANSLLSPCEKFVTRHYIRVKHRK